MSVQQLLASYKKPSAGGGVIPATVPLWAAFEADAETFANNDVLSSITDRTTNVRNGTQSTSVNRGTGVTGQTINGGAGHKAYRTQLTVSGTIPQWWDLPDISALTSSSILSVLKSTTNGPGSSATQMVWFFGTQGDGNIWTYSDHSAYMGFGCNARQNGIAISEDISQWHVLEEESGSGTNGYKLRLNGNIKRQATVTTAFSTTPSISHGYRLSAGFGFDGYYAAIYIGSAKWTSGQRTDLINYVNTKFGFSIS